MFMYMYIYLAMCLHIPYLDSFALECLDVFWRWLSIFLYLYMYLHRVTHTCIYLSIYIVSISIYLSIYAVFTSTLPPSNASTSSGSPVHRVSLGLTLTIDIHRSKRLGVNPVHLLRFHRFISISIDLSSHLSIYLSG